MIKSVLSAFGSFVFSALDFLLFLAILLFLGFLTSIFWPILKWPLLTFLICAIVFFCYLIYKIKEKPKPLEQDEVLSDWAKQELQRPIIQRILQKQKENKPFISGTMTHIGNDEKETRLGNITINLKK
nr:MAG TPA: MerF Protein [Caudoviricetes sp.]